MIFNAHEIKQINDILFPVKDHFIIKLIKLYNLFKENKQLNFKYNYMLKTYNEINKTLEQLNYEYETIINYTFDFNDKNINIMININDKQINKINQNIFNIKTSKEYMFLNSFFEAEKMTNEYIKQYNITDLNKFYPFERDEQTTTLVQLYSKIERYYVDFDTDNIKY